MSEIRSAMQDFIRYARSIERDWHEWVRLWNELERRKVATLESYWRAAQEVGGTLDATAVLLSYLDEPLRP